MQGFLSVSQRVGKFDYLFYWRNFKTHKLLKKSIIFKVERSKGFAIMISMQNFASRLFKYLKCFRGWSKRGCKCTLQVLMRIISKRLDTATPE